MNEHDNYWVDRKPWCKKFFALAEKKGIKAVYTLYGRNEGRDIMKKVRKEYENLLPDVPYVGTLDIMQKQMLLTVIFVLFYRVLKDRMALNDIWTLCNNFNREFIMSLPPLVRWLIKQSTFSRKFKDSFRENAQNQKLENLADQWDYVEGNGADFDYGINITKCAKAHFLRMLGYEEFLPYICLVDKNFAECCHYGFKRTQTIARGAPFCDFRMKKNGPVAIGSAAVL